MRALIPAMILALAVPASAELTNGTSARDFKLRDADGKVVSLSQFKGRTVVVEWHNPGCPFVQKHYRSGNMQGTQAFARGTGAVWLTVNSGAPGKQGHLTGAQAKAQVAADKAQSTDYLLDPSGVVGKAWGAKTTPHLYIVAPSGQLVYQGGIDDKPTANPADIAGARNHVKAALTDMKQGRTVQVAQTRPYGCSVKYAE